MKNTRQIVPIVKFKSEHWAVRLVPRRPGSASPKRDAMIHGPRRVPAYPAKRALAGPSPSDRTPLSGAHSIVRVATGGVVLLRARS